MEVAGRREPAGRRVLGVEARLDGVSDRPAGHGLVDLVGQRRATGDEELEADQVESGHLLGHRVLHLQPGVHLQEVGLAVARAVAVAAAGVEDELDGSGVHVTDGAGGGHRGLGQAGPEGGAHDGRGRLLDDLLVAALDAALPLEQGDGGAVGVGQDLDLDVAGGGDVALEEHRAVAEGGQRFTPGSGQGLGQVVGAVHDPHAPPAASGGGFDQQWPPEPVHLGGIGRGVAVDGDGRQGRHAGRPHHVLRSDLRPHGVDGGRGRPHPHQAGGQDGPGEVAGLGQEPVAGVDGIGAASGGRRRG